MMIKKVFWYCPRCNYSCDRQPIGTECKACGHNDFTNSPLGDLYMKLANEQVEMEPEAKKVIAENFWELLA